MVGNQDWLLPEYVGAFFCYYFSTKKGKCQEARLSRKQPLTTSPWQSSRVLWLWKPSPCPTVLTEFFESKLASKSTTSFKASKPQEAAAGFSRACLEEKKLVKPERDSTFFNTLHKKISPTCLSTCSFIPLQYHLFLTVFFSLFF